MAARFLSLSFYMGVLMKQEKRLQTIDGESLMSLPLKPLNFVVDSLLSQGLHILAGSPKVGKSWLALWPSEVEMKEKKDRVDDALSATRAAIAEGIVPGPGVNFDFEIPQTDGQPHSPTLRIVSEIISATIRWSPDNICNYAYVGNL